MLFMFEVMKMTVQIKRLTLMGITVLFLITSSIVIHFLEPEIFESVFIGFWYVMTTVTTTGYGDFVPETTLGRIVGLFLYFFGIALLGIVIGKIVESFSIYRNLKEGGKLRFKGTNHYVVVGWSHKAKHTINELIEMDTAIHKGSSKLVMHLLSRKSGVDIWKVTKKSSWKTYNDTNESLKKIGANLISDRQDFQLLNKLEEPIPEEAELYVICNKATYEKII